MQSDVFCSSAAACTPKQGNDLHCEGDDSFDGNPPHHKNVSNEGGKAHQKHSRAMNLQAAQNQHLSCSVKTTATDPATSAGGTES